MLGTPWQQKQEKVTVRIPATAIPLPVSDAEMLARDCGKTVTRLCGLRDLIQELPRLGKVKVVASNRHAVHEKIGQLHTVKLVDSQGWIRGEAINLRLFLNHWHYSFAVTEEYDDGYRYSFQFFDRDGSTVYKVYLTADGRREVYQDLIGCYRSADQRPRQSVAPVPRLVECPDEEIDVALLREAWLALQDIQDLAALFRSFGIRRLQGLRVAGSDLAAPIALSDLRILLEVMRDAALPLRFYVGNSGGVQVYTGCIAHLATRGAWCTILDTHFALHLHTEAMSSAWVVYKPGQEGSVAALEFYNGTGQSILQLLSPYQPGHPAYAIWQRLLGKLD
jgi:putative hemin transport protein